MSTFVWTIRPNSSTIPDTYVLYFGLKCLLLCSKVREICGVNLLAPYFRMETFHTAKMKNLKILCKIYFFPLRKFSDIKLIVYFIYSFYFRNFRKLYLLLQHWCVIFRLINLWKKYSPRKFLPNKRMLKHSVKNMVQRKLAKSPLTW